MRSLKGLRAVDIFRFLRYILNPFRLLKWFFYFFFLSLVVSFLTMSLSHAAEWAPAKKQQVPTDSMPGQCKRHVNVGFVASSSFQDCVAKTIDYLLTYSGDKYVFESSYTGTYDATQMKVVGVLRNGGYVKEALFVTSNYSSQYVCPPDGSPDFSVGPVVTKDGTVCQKKPLTCLTGSILETNVITGKEFCRPFCHGIAGNTLGAPGALVTFFSGNIGSSQLSCYGQCSVVSVGASINSLQNPNVYQGVIKFTGQNCPLQVNGQDGNETVSGNADGPTTSQGTADAQTQLQNAASGASANPISGATGTANLNNVVDKIAEVGNAQIKASSQQSAATGKVIEGVGRDIQAAIKDSAAVGSSGASIGQMQTANAIKDGNAALGGKLDAIKDAIEKQDEGDAFPPVSTTIDADPSTINENPNNWAERNYATVLQNHANKMKELPLYSGVSGFFHVNVNGGKCPEFTVDIPTANLPVVGSFGGGQVKYSFCETNMDVILRIIKSVVIVVSTFFAVRYALE